MPVQSFRTLCGAISKCTTCHTIEQSGHAVPYEGDIASPILILGRNPGHTEKDLARPFVGRGRKLLDVFLNLAGLKRSQLMIANLVCCYTAQDRAPNSNEIDSCYHHFATLLDLQKPQLIVVLGKQALQKIIDKDQTPTLTHGKIEPVLLVKGLRQPLATNVMHCWHPGSALRSGSIKTQFLQDAAILKQWLLTHYLTPQNV